MTVFLCLLVFLNLCLAVPVGYLMMLTGVALRSRGYQSLGTQEPSTRFAILIPAHNEELLLPVLLKNLRALTYPRNLYSVFVIADNCTDRTAHVASAGGAAVLARTDETHRGKGFALQWAFQEVEAAGLSFDAVVVLDADSIVSANFLTVMDKYLANGSAVIQAYYAVQNPAESWAGAIRYAAFAGVHFLRPLARESMRFSVGLKGNGMVFRPEILRSNAWTGSITEDIDLHMSLVLQGQRCAFAPEAVVWAEMPNTLQNSQTQHARWERGRNQMARKYVIPLTQHAAVALRQGKLHQARLLLDSAMELVIPPVSILAAGSAAMLLMSWLAYGAVLLWNVATPENAPVWFGLNALVSTVLCVGLGVYILTSLKLAKTPREVYRSLLMVPKYLLWKVFQYVGVSIHPNKKDERWVRTARNQGE